MSQSLVQILVHIVFSTKNRQALIPETIENQLFGFIRGIIENNGARMLNAGGTADHIHLLVSLGKIDIGTLIGDIKRDTSKWMKVHGIRDFYWQRGYGAFSIGQSQVHAVSKYIREQKTHHQAQDFTEEFRRLCSKYGVEIDERYCWD